MRESRRNQRGVALLMVAIMVLALCAMAGLVFDTGWAYYITESARAAAEAAAVAAVQYAKDSAAAHGGAYTCGSNGVVCQAATSCPATVPNPVTNNAQSGCAYAAANGFTNGGLNGKQTVTIQADIPANNAPPVSGITVQYWVSVRVSQSNPLTFLGVLGGNGVSVGVRSTVGVIPSVVTDCIIALHPSASKALTLSGSAIIKANNCSVAVASNSWDALDVSGSASLTADSIRIVGDYNGHGCGACINPTPTTVASVTDPYSSVAAPSFSTSCDGAHTNYKLSNGGATLNPGTYCGGITNSGGALTFNAGTYILYGGGFTQSGGSSSSTGSGVAFYNTCSPSPCNGGQNNYKPFTISGGGTSSISAPTSGSLAGILFFQDRTVKTGPQDTVSGGSSTCFTGVLYFSQTQLTYSGGSSGGSCNTQLVADTINFSGSSNLGSTSGGSGQGPSAPSAAIIE